MLRSSVLLDIASSTLLSRKLPGSDPSLVSGLEGDFWRERERERERERPQYFPYRSIALSHLFLSHMFTVGLWLGRPLSPRAHD